MYLVSDCLESPKDYLRQKFRMHVFAYIALELRNAVSLFSRISAVHRSRRAGAGAGVLTYFAGAGAGAGVCSPPVKL